MSNFSKSAVRTITPIVVGYIAALLVKAGANVTSAQVTLVLGPVISAVYYLLVRLIELKFPKAGILLGVPTKPQYDVKAAVVAAETQVAPAVTNAQVTIADELTKIALPNVTSTAAATVAAEVAPVVAAVEPAAQTEIKKIEKAVKAEVKKVEEKLTKKTPAKKTTPAPKTTPKKNTK